MVSKYFTINAAVKVSPAPETSIVCWGLGDGKWVLQTQNGPVPSVEKTLYKMSNIEFDISHVFNDELIDHFIKIYGDNVLINNNFIDEPTVSTNKLVAKTINIKNNIELITNEFIDNLLKEYNEVI